MFLNKIGNIRYRQLLIKNSLRLYDNDGAALTKSITSSSNYLHFILQIMLKKFVF